MEKTVVAHSLAPSLYFEQGHSFLFFINYIWVNGCLFADFHFAEYIFIILFVENVGKWLWELNIGSTYRVQTPTNNSLFFIFMYAYIRLFWRNSTNIF